MHCSGSFVFVRYAQSGKDAEGGSLRRSASHSQALEEDSDHGGRDL